MKKTLLPFLLAATLGSLAILPAAADAPIPKLSQYQAGFYHFKIGDINITALSDGTLPIHPMKLLTNVHPEQILSRLHDAFQTAEVEASVNAYLIKLADKLVMVDAGTGELYGPTLDKLSASIRAAGYAPEQITDILITHIHTDHTGGLMSGSRMVFPNATLHIAKQEVEYWLSPANMAKAPAEKKQYFDEASAKVQPYVDVGKVKTFDGATEVVSGIHSIPSPGHTPGHTFYVLESKGEKLVFWGDLLHVPDVQMPHPEATIVFDVDQKAAAMTRKLAFADAAKGRYWIAGAHIPYPGVGHLKSDGNGYRWVPMTYINDYYEKK
jgi:glyoxylase-like metal-dependent hydrolase (beta-lactamase superfamily II)